MQGNNKGFTLVELILVITILAILAVVALPKMQNVIAGAENSLEVGVVNNVRSAIRSWRIDEEVYNLEDGMPNYGAYPDIAVVETASAGDDCSSVGCFSGLLTDPVYSEHWSLDRKDAANGSLLYVFTMYGEGSEDTICYTYNDSDGTFSSDVQHNDGACTPP